ncbi:putative dopey, N-terminal domain-containing protein [Neospora caninum Liverpool]|uniref:Putative dopey, N-terminal domain-containing protein n=1 Tax=Neospora caninum (strain Liverpool) TaxID=572307 RepID=F0VKW9_NEOCL|nr:putative dopey, N-terminal domain-containing protein [Neospora caninum Liverpool]CBZ54720.1 putative dopey, N-terminal domain-containing protein [Neospora caninum Liverpool]|eukprot:XP_003884750.1 putative dopey, N-terminal domain-containing protein [Neospora caninum Liverpool]
MSSLSLPASSPPGELQSGAEVPPANALASREQSSSASRAARGEDTPSLLESRKGRKDGRAAPHRLQREVVVWDGPEARRYEAEVLAVLHSFDKAKEWADLNNCLQKLLRVFSPPTVSSFAFSAAPPAPFFPFIPHKAVVAKRLAQCLNPLLPSGVHTRALETYAAIFERIGPDGLSRDLAIYSAGLLPFFQDGATHVKPFFLDLINAYYLPLGRQLIPCLSGLLVSMLPGLDDDKAPAFAYVSSTIWRLRDCVGERTFVAALWLALRRASRVRLAALGVFVQLMTPSLPALLDDKEKIATLLPDREELVVGALEATFGDQSPLVKRQLLDVLITNFPFDQPLLTRKETVRLLRAALRVLPLREWSLTRRFIQWITRHPDGILDVVDLSFLSEHVKGPLIETVKLELESHPVTAEEATYPLKSLSILIVDNEDLEGLAQELMPSLTVPLLRYLLRESTNPTWGSRVVQEAQQLFHSKLTQPDWVWGALGVEMQRMLSSIPPLSRSSPSPPSSSSSPSPPSSSSSSLSREEAAEGCVEVLLLASLYLSRAEGSTLLPETAFRPGRGQGGPEEEERERESERERLERERDRGDKRSWGGLHAGEREGEKGGIRGRDDERVRSEGEEENEELGAAKGPRTLVGIDGLCGMLSLLSDIFEGFHVLAPTFDSTPVIDSLLQTSRDCLLRVEEALHFHSQLRRHEDTSDGLLSPPSACSDAGEDSTERGPSGPRPSSSVAALVSPRLPLPSSALAEGQERKREERGDGETGLVPPSPAASPPPSPSSALSKDNLATKRTPLALPRNTNLDRKRKRFLCAVDGFFSYTEALWLGVRANADSVEARVLATLDLLSEMQVILYRLQIDLLEGEREAVADGRDGGRTEGGAHRQEEDERKEDSSPWPGGCLPTWFCALLDCGQVQQLPVACRALQAFLNLFNSFSPERRRFIILGTAHCDQAAVRLWEALALTDNDGRPRVVGAPSAVADLLLQLEASCRLEKEDVVQAIILRALESPDPRRRLEAIERFSLLWRCAQLQKREIQRPLYSLPMLVVLRALEETEPRIRHAARAFVRQAVGHLPHLLDPIFELLLFVDAPSSHFAASSSSAAEASESPRRSLARELPPSSLPLASLAFAARPTHNVVLPFLAPGHASCSPSACTQALASLPLGGSPLPAGFLNPSLPSCAAAERILEAVRLLNNLLRCEGQLLTESMQRFLVSETLLVRNFVHSQSLVDCLRRKDRVEGGGKSEQNRARERETDENSALQETDEGGVAGRKSGSPPLLGSYEELAAVDYIDLFCIVILRFIRLDHPPNCVHSQSLPAPHSSSAAVPAHLSPSISSSEEANDLQSDIPQPAPPSPSLSSSLSSSPSFSSPLSYSCSAFASSSLSSSAPAPVLSSSASFAAVRGSSAEVLHLFIASIHPVSRAKEVSCLVAEPLIAALDAAVDQADHAMQGLEGANTPFPLFGVAVETKKCKLPHLRSLPDQAAAFLPVLLRSMDLCEARALQVSPDVSAGARHLAERRTRDRVAVSSEKRHSVEASFLSSCKGDNNVEQAVDLATLYLKYLDAHKASEASYTLIHFFCSQVMFAIRPPPPHSRPSSFSALSSLRRSTGFPGAQTAFPSLTLAHPVQTVRARSACARHAREDDAPSASSSRLAFSAALPFINGLAQVLQFLVDTANAAALDAGGDGDAQSSGGALLPFFDLFAWGSSAVSGDSASRQVEAKLAHVTLLLPTIVVASVVAVSATLPRSPHASWRDRSRMRAREILADEGKRESERQRRENERKGRGEGRVERRDSKAQAVDLDARRNEEAVRMRVTAIVDTLFKAFPRHFVQSCLVVWALGLNEEGDKLTALLFILKQCSTTFLTALLPPLTTVFKEWLRGASPGASSTLPSVHALASPVSSSGTPSASASSGDRAEAPSGPRLLYVSPAFSSSSFASSFASSFLAPPFANVRLIRQREAIFLHFLYTLVVARHPPPYLQRCITTIPSFSTGEAKTSLVSTPDAFAAAKLLGLKTHSGVNSAVHTPRKRRSLGPAQAGAGPLAASAGRGDESCGVSVPVAPSTFASGIASNAASLPLFDSRLDFPSPPQDDAEVAWQQLLQLVSVFVAHPRQPVSVLWLVSLLLAFDRVKAAKEATIASKKTRKELQELFRMCVFVAVRQFGSRVASAASGSAFDVLAPLPPQADLVNQAISLTTSLSVSSSRFSATGSCSERAEKEGDDWEVDRLKREQRKSLRARPSLASPPCLMTINKVLIEKQLVSALVPTDAVEIAAHYALAVIVMFCVEIGEINRRSPLTALFLQVLCDDFPAYVLPALHNQSPQAFSYRYLILCVLRYFPTRLFPSGISMMKKALLENLPLASFFAMDRRTLRGWAKIGARVMMSGEPQKIDMLLPAPHAGVFSSKENDVSQRMRYLRRLAFLLLCSGKDIFQPQLPFILEKLTEALKLNASNQAPCLTEQVFLCVRVLLLRLSSSALTPVWPILLTELIKVFSSATSASVVLSPPSSASSPFPSALPAFPSSALMPHAAQVPPSAHTCSGANPSLSLLLAALKVVDVAALLDLPEFHLYQWMFVEETLVFNSAGSPRKDAGQAGIRAVGDSEEPLESAAAQSAPVSSSREEGHTGTDGIVTKRETDAERDEAERERRGEDGGANEEGVRARGDDARGDQAQAGGHVGGEERGETQTSAGESEERETRGGSATSQPETDQAIGHLPEQFAPAGKDKDDTESDAEPMMFIPFSVLLAQWDDDGSADSEVSQASSSASRPRRATHREETQRGGAGAQPAGSRDRGARGGSGDPRAQRQKAEAGGREPQRSETEERGDEARQRGARRERCMLQETDGEPVTGGPLVTLRRVETPQELAQAARAVNAASVAGVLRRTKLDEGLVDRSIENDLLEVSDGMLDLWADLDCPKLLDHLWSLYTCGFDILLPSQAPHAGAAAGGAV